MRSESAIVGASVCAAILRTDDSEVTPFAPGGFITKIMVAVPGAPEEVYDWFTDDIGQWWDHTIWGDQKKLKFEARPGGGFYERLSEEEGARHAEVITAQRGKLLRFVGPLGLSGQGIDLTHEMTFEAQGETTSIQLTVIGNGRVEKGWPEAIHKTWQHFLVERFLPYAAQKAAG